jgi:hypothetical protein
MEDELFYSIEKLNESNYRYWSQVIEAVLDDEDLWELVNGSVPRPTLMTISVPPQDQANSTSESPAASPTTNVNEDDLLAWDKKAKKARRMIISTITASVMTCLEGERNPAVIWRILEDRYRPRT